jgi:hypothetical protein
LEVEGAELADHSRAAVVEEQGGAPVSVAAMRVISTSVSSKSKTSMFSAMRSAQTDIGMTTTPRWISQRRTT